MGKDNGHKAMSEDFLYEDFSEENNDVITRYCSRKVVKNQENAIFPRLLLADKFD